MHCVSSSEIETINFTLPRPVSLFDFGRKVLAVLFVCVALLSFSFAQQAIWTIRGNNARTGANTTETLLTPTNVNKGSFGRLFSTPVDYVVQATPLYVPNVSIAGGIHNVMYVVTQADSVYAIDADNGAQLWWVNFTNPAQGYPAGLTTASGTNLPCGRSVGFTQEGIPGTPVIDLSTNTIYMVAKTVQGGTTVRHDLHALDIRTGAEKFGGPVQITATSTSLKGRVMHFNSKFQKNRPGLLLVNGVLYLGFGSNLCNGNNTGWVLSYNATNLGQLGAFNTSPDTGLTSIWQSGAGLAADSDGYVYAETAESTGYDVPAGGQSYCNSVLKLSPTSVGLADYFTPWSVAFLNVNDLDMSSVGPVILPDQPGPHPHELIATGKQGVAYVLDRDNMGQFSVNDSTIVQEVSIPIGGEMFSTPAYWNNTVYFYGGAAPVQAFQLSNGLLGSKVSTPGRYTGSHSPSISANGNTNGILWLISGGQLNALDALTLKNLYTSGQSGTRDTLPALPNFAQQTVANGRVYVGTKNSLDVFGLFHILSITGGNNQSATVLNALPRPLQIQASNPYSGQPDPGVTVNFSDGCKVLGAITCGSFNPPSAVTDSNGNASTTYTVPQKAGTYTLTASSPNFGNVTATATARAAAAVKIISYGGGKQTAAAGSVLPARLVVQARDTYNNGVPGVTVSFTAKAGVLNPTSGVTDASGLARSSYQLPTTVGTWNVTASSTGLKNVIFPEIAVAGPATSASISSGNGQAAPRGTQLPAALVVVVSDQYGNPVSGVNVTFDDSGAGGSFGNANPAVTDSTGKATQLYTLPPSPGTITIHATAAGVASPAVFTETAQ
jgi:hypothetical protein